MKILKEEKNGKLFYNGYDLHSLAKEYGTPLRISFLDIIREHIISLKESFYKAKKENSYYGNIILVNANKANYGYEEVKEAYENSDGLEVSSYYDLLYTKKILNGNKAKYIVLNGYKKIEYLDLYVQMHEEGYNIIDIIDNIEEYEYLKNKNINFNIGLRIHLESLYHDESTISNDCFGLSTDEINYILGDLNNTKLNLSTIHYHQRGFDYNNDKFMKNLLIAFNLYIKASKKYSSLNIFDIGGGTPLPISENFDYDKWTNEILKIIKKISNENNIKEPNIILENGKFNQKDSTVNIYKVIGIKNTYKYPYYIVDGSILIAMPEFYALGEPIEVRPINNLKSPKIKVILAGNTCDCDDIYYLKDKGYFEVPEGNEIYIGILGTGAYQNSMNGKGGIHHCLLPEEKNIIIKNDKITIRKELQSIEDVYRIIGVK